MAAFIPYGKKNAQPEDSGLSSGFGFWQSERNSTENSGLLGGGNFASRATASMMGAASGATQMGGDTFGMMKSLMEDPISMNQWIAFGVCLVVGGVLMAMSFLFLPMILLAPQKFSGLFTLGSLCFFMSFAALRGPAKFASHLLTKERLPFSISYVGSMIGTLYSANILRSYILTLVFTGIQVLTFSFLVNVCNLRICSRNNIRFKC